MENKTTQDILEKYPSLKNFIERMSEVAEDILSKAIEQSSEDNRNYIAELEKYNKPGEPIISPALLDDASMCDADFENAKFKRCSLRHFTAEEADFKDSDFYNCDLRGAYFTHSNFTKSKMADCNFHETSFMNSCLESWIGTNCNLNIADMSNVSYLESEWLNEQEVGITMGGM